MILKTIDTDFAGYVEARDPVVKLFWKIII